MAPRPAARRRAGGAALETAARSPARRSPRATRTRRDPPSIRASLTLALGTAALISLGGAEALAQSEDQPEVEPAHEEVDSPDAANDGVNGEANDGANDEASVELADDEARAHFEAGRLAFVRGRYERALEAFRLAHELSGHAELLFNIGQAADRLRRDEVALEAFERFVAELPDHPQRAAVQARMEVLRAAIAQREAEERQEEEARDPGAGPWVLIIGGAALAAGGAVSLGVALAERADLESLDPPRPWPEIEEQYDRVPILSTVGFIGMGVGVALATAGVIWVLAGSADTAEVALRPAGLEIRGRL